MYYYRKKKVTVIKKAYIAIDEKIDSVLNYLGMKMQALNCKFVKRNHKYLVYNRTCMRCGYQKSEASNELHLKAN